MFAKKKSLHAALLAAGLLVASSNAAVFADNGQRGERRGPPQAAFNACHGKPAGASCEMQGPRGTMSGACREFNGQTACAPAMGGRGPGGQGPRPPQ